jgi:hypothetical protein
MIVFSFSSLIACSNDKKEDKEASVNACLFDPTGNCARAVMAQCQANPAMCNSLASSPAVAPYLNGQNLGNVSAPAVQQVVTGFGSGAGTQIQASVSDAQLKTMAAKNAAALSNALNKLNADNSDDGGSLQRVIASVSAQIPVDQSPSKVSAIPEQVSDMSGDSSAAR